MLLLLYVYYLLVIDLNNDFINTISNEKSDISFRYIEDVRSLNCPNFKDYLHLIYPSELEIKETTDTSTSASYLDLYLYIDNTGRLKSKLYDKRVLLVFHVYFVGGGRLLYRSLNI